MTEQEENQIMAALALWRAVAMTSRVHPAEHPACKPFFEEQRPLPLEDIERLMCMPLMGTKVRGLISIREAIEGTKISANRLRSRLKKNNAEVIGRSGATALYLTGEVRLAMHVLRADEEQFKRRYNLDEVEDPTSPTSGD